MSTVVIKRSARRPAPEIPSGELAVDAPPEIPPIAGGRWQQAVMALPMLGGSVAMALMMSSSGGGAYRYVVGGLFGVSSVGMLATGFGVNGAPKKAEMMAHRREYLRHLAGLRRRVRETANMQRIGLLYRYPDPAQLWSTAGSHRVWERRAGDPDFGVVRLAVGPQTLATPLIPPVTRPLDELEPMTAGALRRFLDAYSVVPDLPVAVSLRGFARVYLRGSGPGGERAAQGLTRAVLTQLATFHAPDDLLIAVAAGPERRVDWEWIKWLPHNLHPARTDRLGHVRLVAGSGAELDKLLEDVIGNRPRFTPAGPTVSNPHVVIVLDGVHLNGTTQLDVGLDGVTVLDLDAEPPRLLDRSLLALEAHTETGGWRSLYTYTMDSEAEVGTPDQLSVAQAEAVARRLSPFRLATISKSADTPLANEFGLADLLGVGDPEAFNVAQHWLPRPNRDKLRVPIGVAADGSPIELDFKESAQDGMGPHGLLIGATGSGKSELLRTLVLALAATHSSETLNFILVDFKGGATFASLDRTPHTAAFITNLEDDLQMVDRLVDAVEGELLRRQELLHKSGNYASLRDYEKARVGGAPLPPLPSLLVIVDEFGEMLEKKPGFIDVFVQIGRLGRSLGVHLLLASQKLEEGRLRGLDSHLSYRIGLRTFSAMESRVVLGVQDAYELPRAPGHGYMRYGTEPLQRFKAAYVSGPLPGARAHGAGPNGAGSVPMVLTYSTNFVPAPPAVEPAPPEPEKLPVTQSVLDVMVDRIAGQGPPAHQVWLPPLGQSPALDELLGPVVTDPVRGLTFANPELHGALQVPIALIDKPREQLRDVMWLQLAGSAGHVAIVGSTLSGKSSAIRAMICGLALTHTPAEVQIYCLDFGGGSVSGLRGLPHVGGVSSRLDTVGVRRTVGEISSLLSDRETRFAALGVDSMASYRRRRATAADLTGSMADGDPFGDVFLCIDGWGTLRKEYEELEPVITDIATRGLSYGIHVVVATSRWMDFRPGIRDLFGSRVELRLGDPTDSMVSRRAADSVPEKQPGRGLVEHPTDKNKSLHMLTVRPELSTMTDTGQLVHAIATAWPGPLAPRVRLLPDLVPYTDLDVERSAGLRIPIGISEADLGQVEIDFASDPHFLLFGDAECGKSSFLRALGTTIIRKFQPEEARLFVIDYRHSLMELSEAEHSIGHAMHAAKALELGQAIAGYMERRLPGPDVTAQQLRDKSWWQGPQLFVLVDDYDLVVAGPNNPLTPILEYLSQARDIGLHLILTRRAGGAGRSLFDPVIQRVRELASPGLVMSGSPDEGSLIGPVRPTLMPPGRGRLVTRREGVRLIQLAHQPGYSDVTH